MPVRKFRSIEEMNGNTWRSPGDSGLHQAIRETWEFAQKTLQPRFPPGVYKHRSIEDAEKFRESWERDSFDAYQERMRSRRRT